ncbi:MAG: fibronectin type III domain-containing protein [Desulfosarcinaceae bacterium]|jgi:hypothetical protein
MTKQTTILTIVLASLLFMIPVKTLAGEITLAWDPNNETDLAGYRLYMREGAQVSGFGLLVDIPLTDIESEAPSFTVFDLEADTRYYFAITAYNANGDESGRSNSVCVLNDQPCVVNSSASSSGGCFLDTLNTPSVWETRTPAH